MLLQGKTALVTGMTRGIGKAIAQRYAQHGANVAGIYLSGGEEVHRLEHALSNQGVGVKFYQGDVADADVANYVVADVIGTFGGLDVLVNNAGITRDGFVMQMSDDNWQQVFETNFGGTYNFSMAALKYFSAVKMGHIINMVSVTGVLGREAQANYGMTKGAIIGLTRLMARLHAPEGIRFNLVAPGMIETDILAHVAKDRVDNFVRHTAMKRLGKPEEIADIMVLLASDLSSYLSTTALRLDGGFLR